jgi:hypothetical protein
MSRSFASLLVALTVATVFPLAALAEPPGESHRALEGAADIPSPEALSRRLRLLSDSREAVELARRLLDQGLLDQLGKKIDPSKLKELKEQLQHGENIGADPVFQDLLKTVQKNPAVQNLTKDESDLLSRTFPPPPPPSIGRTRSGRGPLMPPTGIPAPHPGHPDAITSPTMPPPGRMPPPEPPKSSWDEWRQQAYRWAREHSTEFSDRVTDLLRSLGGDDVASMVGDGLRSLGQGMQGEDGLAGKITAAMQDVGGSLAGLAEKLPPSVGSAAWNDITDVFRESIPSLPKPGRFSLPTVSAGAVQDTAPLVLWVAIVAAVVALLWRSTGGRRGASAGAWRIGPWPVAPGAVTTHRDLVLAFEHLALLCLGLAARSCHHLELAARLAALKADPRQRQAAAELAQLYEQARYAPDAGPLTEEDLGAARRDLCLLAGVARA